MAIEIAITVPDESVNRIKAAYTSIILRELPEGSPDPTNAEIAARVKLDLKNHLKWIVKDEEWKQAQAQISVPPIEIT